MLVGGRYRTGDLLGSGGGASVYRAMDEALGRQVALKLFAPATEDDDKYRRQHTETLLLAKLNHPGLVTLLDAGLHTDASGATTSYLVMELVEGEDLRRLLARGPLPPPDVAQIGADLADALNYVHQQGVIHRDIKPGNILLSGGGTDTRYHPKLTDFGVARLLDAPTATSHGATIGTANYLSPEQALGETITPATDIYSLGLVLLECLTGEKAFPGPPVESAVARLLRDPQIPQSLGDGWGRLLTAMTARDPLARPSAHDVAVTLRSWSEPAVTVHLAPEAAVAHVPVAETAGTTVTGGVIIPTPPNRAPTVG
ncbi:serine/threonine-protein kinase [Arthrobacter sp. GCM10027362]|uniref:serine/threonine-protein kinase n=1 Tax=Arthrobacter sp. GCM10027362 TaxID=3273379 RepID=UPI00362A0DE6